MGFAIGLVARTVALNVQIYQDITNWRLQRRSRSGWKPSDVLLMPEGVTMEQIRTKAGWLGELCKQRGYRYAHRLQIELYGNKRGT